MITYKKDNKAFVYRVAGIAIFNNKLLVHRSIKDDFWALPGGRCEMLEISKDALIREMKEEIGADIIIKRPLYFVENFFHFKSTDFHELSIYYLMGFSMHSKWILEEKTFYGKEEELENENDVYERAGLKLIFKWVDLNKIEDIRLYPLFLRKSLKDIKPYIEHIINFDD